MEKVRKAEVPPPTQLNPAIPPELEAILKKAMAKEPEDRYQTASEMEMALEDLITKKGYAFSSLSLSHYMQALFAEEILNDTRRFQLLTSQAHQTAPVEDRSTVVRPAHAAATPVPADPAAAVRKSISQSKIVLPPPKGRRLSRWVSATLFLTSWSVFLLLLFLSDISFVARLRSKFPFLEESKVKIAASLEGTGLLSFLDRFKEGIFQLVETGEPEPSSVAPPPKEEAVAVMLARPESEAASPVPPGATGSEAECRRRLPLLRRRIFRASIGKPKKITMPAGWMKWSGNCGKSSKPTRMRCKRITSSGRSTRRRKSPTEPSGSLPTRRRFCQKRRSFIMIWGSSILRRGSTLSPHKS
ncbi:MAG: hypothetical protein MPW14_22530 [Candidatus Manganitrophus sp.]|nr:MAG: hypothetical protein MPW14_22530 [Candidatus Manganitrophus sp.]